ncbi:Uncharacterised protein [Bordetella pertussis]|nr:Uncharacterised protein [Bordetella pertussis]CFU86855.1 Uncharacterised protein [Bordetella pertussis]CPL38250.1 Uncharacterised protein [Bordetella pertussis]CPN86722.1 Uncharacterised protein [Bordetella pertussis]
MTPKPIRNWKVSCPMLNAWVAMNWLACIMPAVSFSWMLPRSARSKRASTSCTVGGRASMACCR